MNILEGRRKWELDNGGVGPERQSWLLCVKGGDGARLQVGWVYMFQRLELKDFPTKLVSGRFGLPAPTEVRIHHVLDPVIER